MILDGNRKEEKQLYLITVGIGIIKHSLVVFEGDYVA